MSADLLAAFGSEISTGTSKDAHAPSESLPIQTNGDTTWQSWPRQSQQLTEQRPEPLWRSQDGRADVLFDADEDEFGEFEEAGREVPVSISVPATKTNPEDSVDLLGLQAGDSIDRPLTQYGTAPQPQKENSRPREDDDWGAFESTPSTGSAAVTSITAKKAPTTTKDAHRSKAADSTVLKTSQTRPAIPASQQFMKSDSFDEWDDWDNVDDTKNINTESTSSLTKTVRAAIQETQERPTNIPPPAVLLNLIPKVLLILSSSTSSPTETGMQVVEVYRVCARLIAGRALRWKRDTILAQSMRISAAGRSGGMKLTALDKGESRKEDQEVEEVLSAFSRLSTKLNAAIAKAKLQKPPLSLSKNIVARTATGPDIVNATHPCPVCGLKRSERINGIDIDVSDTFGEFWVEHWGHKDCYDFWYRYNILLDQR